MIYDMSFIVFYNKELNNFLFMNFSKQILPDKVKNYFNSVNLNSGFYNVKVAFNRNFHGEIKVDIEEYKDNSIVVLVEKSNDVSMENIEKLKSKHPIFHSTNYYWVTVEIENLFSLSNYDFISAIKEKVSVIAKPLLIDAPNRLA